MKRSSPGNKSSILWSDDQVNHVIDMYVEKTMTPEKISHLFGCSTPSIRNLLIKNDIKIRTYTDINIKYTRNSNYFDVIDTEEKAYWLGFLYADGCVREDRNNVRLGLSSVDERHIEKFRDSLESNAPIKRAYKRDGYKVFEQSFISIGDHHMMTALVDKGCVQNKSLILKFPSPDKVPNLLIGHFIRGYFDGDGGLHLAGKYKNTDHQQYKISFIGSNMFLPELQKRLGVEHLKLESKNGRYSSLTIMGHDQCLKILKDIIYKDAHIYLDRKYQKYLEFLNYIKAFKEKTKVNFKNANRIGKQCKLAREDAEEIRKIYSSGVTVPEIMKLYPVKETQIYRIINYQRWK